MEPDCFFCGSRGVVEEREGRETSASLIVLLQEENLINFLAAEPQQGSDQACFNCFTRACRLARLTSQLAELRRTIVGSFLNKSTEDYKEANHKSSEAPSTGADSLLSKLLDCRRCDKKFRSLKGYNNHMKRHQKSSNTKEPFCKMCKRVFSTSRQYARHQYSVHYMVTPVSCDTCERNFHSEKSLSMHNLEVHSQNAPCNMCDKVFFTATNLAVHKKNIHSETSNNKELLCEYCSGSFSNHEQLKQHQKRHFGSEYPCNLCEKTFRWDSSLNSHMQAAHNSSPPAFKCNNCGRCFKDKNNYIKHMFTHSNVKPYSCTMCRKGFIRKDLLRKHETSCSPSMIKNPTEKPQIRTYVKSKVVADD